MALTDKFLKSKKATSEGKPHKDYPDGGGLLARVYKSGSITFYYRYRWQGKQAIAKIGSYPETTLKEARELHQSMRQGVDRGVDPRNKLVSHRGSTIADGFNQWFVGHVEKNRKNPEVTKRHFKRHILPKYGTLIIDEMTIPEWENMLTIPDSPVLSGLLLRECKSMCGYLVRKQLITTELMRYIKTNDVGTMPNKRDRVYTKTELKSLLSWCEDQTNPVEHRLPMLMVMLFGCRVMEIALADRNEFDFDEWTWTVPKEHSKGKIQIKRPIPEIMRPMFNELFDLYGKVDVFLPNTNGSHITPANLSRKLNSLRDVVGIKGMICHSFRHTLATHYADLGAEYHIAEKTLGHVLGGVSSIYNRSFYISQQEEAMGNYLNWIRE